ncbi:GNAT family N-acetyltransferase [Gloeobacter morelensis]|uniref:GNAT family N-acetyltransferase n=1 Tax=Gloeobacter morelensis MG652769 TaxID=2781736 RepID=A0ABY3PI36_9CYAN|nr:GNAT family N-acetyltransferase [Gloeobacter morelensis]UFP93343.1 GNAT family N-acetyltransferase [Gloeobacter morelensis MG652769]
MIRLRPYEPGDAPALIHLFRDTVRRINVRDYSPEQVAAWAPEEIDSRVWEGQLTDRFAVVAQIGEAVVGFTDFESDGHLDRFYVHADYQGRGVGGAMLAAVEAEAVRLGLDRVFTEASITARPFFERRGFRVLQAQTVVRRGEKLVNYRMEKRLGSIESPN